MLSVRSLFIAVAASFALLALAGARLEPAKALSADLFFSEYIEGSSNNKALEIFNGTGSTVDLAAGGYQVRMYFNGNPAVGLTINLVGSVTPGDVFVLAQSAADPVILAQADQTNGAGWFNGDDAVALTKGGAAAEPVDVIGQIGLDPGTEWGTGLTSTADNTLRRKSGISAGDTNGEDPFDPAVEWDGFAINTFDGLGFHFSGGDAPPVVSSTSPANGAAEVPESSNITVNFSEPVTAADGWYTISCSASGDHTAVQSGGPQIYTLDPDTDFSAAEICTVTVDASKVTDVDLDDPPDQMAANHSFSFTTIIPTVTQIGQVQGSGHLSPYAGQLVKVEGVVIGKRGSNTWIEDVTPDADPATSEAVLVFGSSVANAVAVGDLVQTTGTVSEFRPGCTPSCDPASSAFSNLTITELASPGLGVAKLGTSALPAFTVIGAGGRVPPTEVIEDDSGTGNVETGNTFDPAQDGIDFYETLESMLVEVRNPVVVGPRNAFGEILVLADDGAGASIRTVRGGIVIRPTDFNPERIMLDDLFVATPTVDVADHFTAAAGVMTYDFANYKIAVTSMLQEVDGGLQREVIRQPTEDEVVVGTYNVENLDPGDDSFARHADLIVNHLRAPDILAIEEIQDNDGAADTAVTDASATWNGLIAAIQAAGGPTYQYRQIDPVDDQDGGEPGGNIRVGFLFRTDRAVEFIDRPGGGSTTPTTVIKRPSGPRLSFSPGRVDPGNPAWLSSRKPLAGEFKANGKTLYVIANHFNSKGGDQPLFGRFQPPTRSSEVQRHAQAQVVNSFVDSILAADPNANVIVLGDINDFEFSETVQILSGGVLTSLMETLPKPERYSYVFEGNSQVLDQVVVSDNVLDNFFVDYDPVHVNSEFADQASDHDPQVARLDLRGRPKPK
ncbi:MAG TPA: Ig-like domain-containing protein [Gaiellaceae bacterium]|nr:Ig-like domain-containing protein [Gaiellaceae bacterium]